MIYPERIRIILYGTGKTASTVMKKLVEIGLIQIVAVVDGNILKKGETFCGYIIQTPEEILSLHYDYIFIASVFIDEIKKNLTDNLNISGDKIISDNKLFIEKAFIKNEYLKHYNNRKKDTVIQPEHIKKLVVYTAVFGDYDELYDPEYVDVNCDYICFTDNNNLYSDVWDIRYIDKAYVDPNRAAKIYKILPHHYFSEYDWSIWIDANCTIKGSMLELLLSSVGISNMAFLIHTERNCIYDEADKCIKWNKDREDIILKQISKYRNEGYPDKNSLICGSCIIRKHNDSSIKKLMEYWWEEICNYSRRDQISFNYAAWKEIIFYDLMKIHTFENPYFITRTHKSK